MTASTGFDALVAAAEAGRAKARASQLVSIGLSAMSASLTSNEPVELWLMINGMFLASASQAMANQDGKSPAEALASLVSVAQRLLEDMEADGKGER